MAWLTAALLLLRSGSGGGCKVQGPGARSGAHGGLAGGGKLLVQQTAQHLADCVKAGVLRVVVLQAALDEGLQQCGWRRRGRRA